MWVVTENVQFPFLIDIQVHIAHMDAFFIQLVTTTERYNLCCVDVIRDGRVNLTASSAD